MSFKLLSALLLFTSCIEDVSQQPLNNEEIEDSNPQVISESTSSNKFYLENGECVPNAKKALVCTDQIKFSKLAQKTLLCSYDGKSVSKSPCLPKKCIDGYAIEGNKCSRIICKPGESSEISCVDQVSNAIKAIKIKYCNSAGTFYYPSRCKIKECKQGFHQEENTCLSQQCNPKEIRTNNCTGEIPFASKAENVITCRDDGMGETVSECKVKNCISGYIKDGNTCIKIVSQSESIKDNSQSTDNNDSQSQQNPESGQAPANSDQNSDSSQDSASSNQESSDGTEDQSLNINTNNKTTKLLLL